MKTSVQRTSLYLCISSIFSLCLSAPAQQPAATENASTTQAAPHTLSLDIVVTDKSGKAIGGLTQQDLTVLDNKQPAKILSFTAQGAAASTRTPTESTQIFVLIDEVNTNYSKAWYGREGVKKFLTQNSGELPYPVSLGFLTDSGLQVQTQPSTDGNAMAAALDQQQQGIRAVGTSGTGFYGAQDRLRLSLDALDSFIDQQLSIDQSLAQQHATIPPTRKLVLWVSPGWPLLSNMNNDLTEGQRQQVYDKVVRLSNKLRAARMTLYSINPLGAAETGSSQATYYQNFTNGLKDARHAERADLGLQVLATQTGGRVIFGNDSIQNSLNHCAADATPYYTVTIAPAPAEKPNEYHSLEVKTATPGLTARTRTGYYTQP